MGEGAVEVMPMTTKRRVLGVGLVVRVLALMEVGMGVVVAAAEATVVSGVMSMTAVESSTVKGITVLPPPHQRLRQQREEESVMVKPLGNGEATRARQALHHQSRTHRRRGHR